MTGDTERQWRAMGSWHEEASGNTQTSIIKVMPDPSMAQNHSQQRQSPAVENTKISIAVDPVALITTECITVTSAMRKHARWAHSSVSAILGGGPTMATGSDTSRLPRQNDKSLATTQTQPSQTGRISHGAGEEDDSLASRWGLRGKRGRSMQDNPLLSAFARLRNDLRGCPGEDKRYDSILKELIFVQISEASISLPCSTLSFKSYALPRLRLQSPLLQSLR